MGPLGTQNSGTAKTQILEHQPQMRELQPQNVEPGKVGGKIPYFKPRQIRVLFKEIWKTYMFAFGSSYNAAFR